METDFPAAAADSLVFRIMQRAAENGHYDGLMEAARETGGEQTILDAMDRHADTMRATGAPGY